MDVLSEDSRSENTDTEIKTNQTGDENKKVDDKQGNCYW